MALTGREQNELTRLIRTQATLRRDLAFAVANNASGSNKISKNLRQVTERIRELEIKKSQVDKKCERCRKRPVAKGQGILCEQCTDEVKREQGK